jgi:hypothetical protein
MTDGEGGLRPIGEIQRAVAEEYGWPDGRGAVHTVAHIDPSAVQAYTGVFLFGGQFQFTITQANGKLYVQYPPFGDQPQELFAESNPRFFMTNQPVVIDFPKEPDGAIKRAQVRNGPEQLNGERIAETSR